MPVSLSLQVFGLTILPPVQCYTNNASLTSIPETLIIVNDRRLRADIVRLKEMISEENVKVCWVDGKLTEIGASTLSRSTLHISTEEEILLMFRVALNKRRF